MRIDDVRRKINNSFLYKRFAYRQSEGFIALIRFLEDEELIDDFCEECNFKRRYLVDDLECYKIDITLDRFFLIDDYSFLFKDSKKGYDFWCDKIFGNKNFKKIENKLL